MQNGTAARMYADPILSIERPLVLVGCVRILMQRIADRRTCDVTDGPRLLLCCAPPRSPNNITLVPAGITWTLDVTVYGLRESLKLWGDERDKQLRAMQWADDNNVKYRLRQSSADSQIWFLVKICLA